MSILFAGRESLKNSTPTLKGHLMVSGDNQSNNQARRVCILIFDEVEVLDFCGPFEVFSVTGGRQGETPFEVCTVAEEERPVRTRGGLTVTATYSFKDCPPADILLIPGGPGTRQQLHNENLLVWIKDRSKSAQLVLSVCSGALLLAKAGLLDGLTATTHHGALNELRLINPNVRVNDTRRFVDNGRIIASAGISAGIDMSLHVVSRLLGNDQALETAEYMEYDWSHRFRASLGTGPEDSLHLATNAAQGFQSRKI